MMRTSLALLLIMAVSCQAFAPSFIASGGQTKLFSTFENKEDPFMASLKARQSELNSKKQKLEEHWLKAKCRSSVPIALDGDWVRRLDVDYPLVACGTSSSNVVVHNVENGEFLAATEGQEEEYALDSFGQFSSMLYSGFDGGGTIAIAMHRDLICSSARHGSVQVWRMDENNPTLVSQGSMESQRGMFVTCLKMDAEYLWVGRADGKLQAFPHSNKAGLPLALQIEPELEWQFPTTILSMTLSPDIGHGVVTLANGSVKLFSMDDDDDTIHSWSPPLEQEITQNYLISCAIVQLKDDSGYTIACGATDGSLFLQPIQYLNGVLGEYPFQIPGTEMKPKHYGPLKCLASPGPGLLVSGGQDGSIRMWSLPQESPRFLYQFIGYKVWMGSLWTDGKRIISDGSDNTIIVHDFEKGEDDKIL